MRVETHHYTPARSFERSFDVYRPSPASSSDDGADSGAPRPVVALVVGSAWLGHRPLVYLGTSWWNSSGPKRVASLGYTCVCVRHRGSFPRAYSPFTLAVLAAASGLIAWLAGTALRGVGEREVFVAVLTALVFLVEAGGRGSASFGDMQGDVADALGYIVANRRELGLDFRLGGEPENDGRGRKRPRLVLGGYSSGGHVCASIVRRSDLWRDRGLPYPSDLAGGMLYVSPVLATRAWTPAAREGGRGSGSGTRGSGSPTWFTDGVLRMVFGREGAGSVPSPLHEVLDGGGEESMSHPDVPHVLVGCRDEVFGLGVMDTFFAAEEYSRALRERCGVDSRYRSVESDHWSVLGSRALGDALEEELEGLRGKMAGR